jgi:acetoacetate decarboxylase
MKFGYSMPSTAPLYPEPPFHYENNTVISIVFRTAPETLQELVPAPLRPNPDHLAFIYVGVFNVPGKATYREAGVGIPAFFGETFGSYLVYLYLDPALAIIPGREIWGWPKKDAEITFTEEQRTFHASVIREGVTLIRASVNASERVEPIPDQPDTPSFNLKLIPSVKKNHPPDILQLTSTTVSSRKKELYRGPATLAFTSATADPLGNIPVLEIISGEQSIEDMSLDCGDVLFDYLPQNQQ